MSSPLGTDLLESSELTLNEAAERTGLSPVTLRVLLHRRRLVGRKHGRDWFVTPTALIEYLRSRDARGRRPHDPKARRWI